MNELTQEQLIVQALALEAHNLENTPDVYALGLLQGRLKQADELGYEMSDEELVIHTRQYYNMLHTDYTDVIKFNSLSFNDEIHYKKNSDSVTVLVKGIQFDFDILAKGSLVCVDVNIVDQIKAQFESTIFFWFDWLEDIVKSISKIDIETVRYQVSINQITSKLYIDR